MPSPFFRRWLLLFALAFLLVGAARGEEVIPEAPTRYFNDYALTVKPETADRLNKELEGLEKQSSNQILVCIYPRMQTESSIEDYTHRIVTTWHLGQKGKDNAAVLFVFVQDRKMRIETRPGLEGALPDAICKRIISDEIAPRFKANDYDGGMTVGVESMIQATRGEYQGSGRTHYQDTQGGQSAGGMGFFAILFVFFVLFLLFSAFRRELRSPGGRGGGTMYTGGGPIIWGGGFGNGGGYSGGGSSSSSSSDGGGFFSAGGGSDIGGGGGASGDW